MDKVAYLTEDTLQGILDVEKNRKLFAKHQKQGKIACSRYVDMFRITYNSKHKIAESIEDLAESSCTIQEEREKDAKLDNLLLSAT